MNLSIFSFCRYGAYLVLLCNVAMSYAHALDLFHDLVDLPYEILYHVGVISLDMVFILSVMVLTESGGRGWPPWLCFIFGLGFTTWSNIRPAVQADNWEGIALGICTVVALLLLKIMISWMERNPELFGQALGYNPGPGSAQMGEVGDHRVTEISQMGEMGDHRVAEISQMGEMYIPEEEEPGDNLPVGESEYPAGDEWEEPGETSQAPGVEPDGNDWEEESEPEPVDELGDEDIPPVDEPVENLPDDIPVGDEPGEEVEGDPPDIPEPGGDNPPPGELDPTEPGDDHPPGDVEDLMGDDKSPGLEKTLTKALEIIQSGEKLPGRRKLAEIAGTTEHYAKRAKEILSSRGIA
ncbi:hypothetical protein [Thermoactinomyces sp. CICC 23799]|uniref:hypothetical protein n=1 Tax=Thermoactinomyces sp. CICC 23799 TaxID=2767429 RepID=UPI0018DCEE77|nr:hypothetical protein [Thermoactinomyces sp. CICC 23799]MBH8600533.1 hypothetical protein [Thermoactinomyces sp. CICC 23799]